MMTLLTDAEMNHVLGLDIPPTEETRQDAEKQTRKQTRKQTSIPLPPPSTICPDCGHPWNRCLCGSTPLESDSTWLSALAEASAMAPGETFR